jgi:hypothetical protein
MTSEISKMNRKTAMAELERLEITFDPAETLPELKARLTLVEKAQDSLNGEWRLKKDPMTGLSTLLKRDLVEIAENLGLFGAERKGKSWKAPTVGELLLGIRQLVKEMPQQHLGYGKHKALTYEQLPLKYYQWAIQEVADNKDSSGDGLRKTAMYGRLLYGKYPNQRLADSAETDSGDESRPKSEARAKAQKEAESREPDLTKQETVKPEKKAPEIKAESKELKLKGVKTEYFLLEENLPATGTSSASTGPSPPQWSGRIEDWPTFNELCKHWAQQHPTAASDAEISSAAKRRQSEK